MKHVNPKNYCWLDDWLALILTDCMEVNIMAGVLALTVTDHRKVKTMAAGQPTSDNFDKV